MSPTKRYWNPKSDFTLKLQYKPCPKTTCCLFYTFYLVRVLSVYKLSRYKLYKFNHICALLTGM